MALALPLLDTALAIGRRFLRQQPIFGADRGHIHHRLLNRGFSTRKVALVLYACCALGAMSSLAAMNRSYGWFAIVVFCAATWVGIGRLGYVEFGLARRLVIHSAFRRNLNRQIALQTLRQDFAAAAHPDDCWSVIQKAAKDFGIHELRMNLAGRLFEHRNPDRPPVCWTVRVPLSAHDFIELTRDFEGLDHAALEPLVRMLRETLSAKLPLFEALDLTLSSVASAGRRA